MIKRGSWSTRYGFYLATVGSAFSLGNLWRFPYIVETSGGGAFVLLYILLALALGLPVVIAELMLGKATRQSVISASETIVDQKTLDPKAAQRQKRLWLIPSYLSNIVSVILLSFYAVICGWVLFFLMQYLAVLFGKDTVPHEVFEVLMNNGFLQVGLMSVHLLLTAFIVSLGLRQGIERLSAIVMPIFTALMIFLVVKSISLPGAVDALRFLFYPNFSNMTLDTLVSVLGHVFFTLSVGMGAMVVFGSYLQDDAYVPRAGFKVAILDITVSLFTGFLIFPILFTVEKPGSMGPALLFKILPYLFDTIGLGKLFGFFFFVCLYLAALGASIMLLETSVANLIDRNKIKRRNASWVMIGFTFLLALPPALSSTILKNIRHEDIDLLRLYDKILIERLLPLTTLGIALIVGFGMKKEQKIELFINENEIDSDKLYRNWHFLIRWVVPLVIILGLVLSFLKS